jgi:16S rRNA G527 N7-methylase RsmG
MFKSPKAQWEKILTQPLEKQSKFLNKICKVNRRDNLIIREAFFDNLSFELTRKIFKLVIDVVHAGTIDYSFQDIIFDRLLGVSGIAHLYPEDPDSEENIIFGEGYHVYTASYHDLDILIKFIESNKDINSVCDLGSGSGRAIFYLALHANRQIEYKGLELVDDRVQFTNAIVHNFNLTNVSFKTSNFLETPQDFNGYDSYYLYDPVGTDDVELLISYFARMIANGDKFYIMFISGWDEIMLEALNNLEGLKLLSSVSSHKQLDRYINFYKVE